jgi:hypothetical protein
MLIPLTDDERRKLAQWLCNIVSAEPAFEATPGTGEWFLLLEEFTEWLSGRYRVLYCPGNGASFGSQLLISST